MDTCEFNGISVHHYADTLLNQPHFMFNAHPQFRLRSAGGTYTNPNDNVHIYRLAVADIQKLIIEALEVTIDEQ